jgi:hypothetical protein
MTSKRFYHGGKGTPEYNIWKTMRQRCNNPNDKRYVDWGGRGIRVCAEWDDFGVFITDVGKRPSPKHSLDRMDNDGNYEPGNVRWVLASDQALNKRDYKCNQTGYRNITVFRGKFVVQIRRGGVFVHRSTHASIELAVAKRDEFLLRFGKRVGQRAA